MIPIDPTMGVSGAEWAIPSIAPATQGAPAAGGDGGFGGMLSNAIGSLEATQTNAAQQSQALATGQTDDINSVVSAVEKARLSMELASVMRTKAVEAYSDIFHTQV